MADHWVDDCPKEKQQLKPVDFRRLQQIARRATKKSHPYKEQRSRNKTAEPLAEPMEIDPLPQVTSTTAPTTEGAALAIIPIAPVAPEGNCEMGSGCQRPVMGICDDRECQMRFCEQHRDHMCENRFPI